MGLKSYVLVFLTDSLTELKTELKNSSEEKPPSILKAVRLLFKLKMFRFALNATRILTLLAAFATLIVAFIGIFI